MSRAERVAALIREEVSKIILQDVSDPRIGFISVTGVDVSPDLKNASIYISVFGDEEKKQEAMAGLSSATSFVRGKLGNMLQLRSVPEIRFVRDDSLERGGRILGILSQLDKSDDKQETIRDNKEKPEKS
ncbi:ribosome-binding factor A [candidate division WOR-1 bacterium RIFOXYB2_FULL_42_35]|uniref:Ribosome-binding factor A n=1 Tax=candidate division WOR-1 bacterium RIFOXYC2_FULL_41_25 TaxID=1802586 RepID=A0A1F4TIE2_UNCSA|nr:MAG: ribosome-binding factor A [candidate division WOR-1 bacterium RIFOXYA2_FULL_41_14]OGC24065.1 MAG: ribosome-binding factor A [candidate division WOR-1 bacterium RIFOXYB2_FULL_42_35]OGC32488.1 MAG: ribosome-binding factor A [candidate division WOR-1 bacterium RIFOXYC2_FULL_41_25]